MNKDELLLRLMGTFLGELEEHVRTLVRDLLALEQGTAEAERAQLLASVFRAAHSLKGAARAVDLNPVAGLCHGLEELLAALRDGRRPLDPPSFQLLFATVDTLEAVGKTLQAGRPLEVAAIDALVPALEAAAKGATPRMPAPKAEEEPRPQKAASVGATVRLPLARLEALSSLSRELLVARRRLGVRASELVELGDFVGQWRLGWRRMMHDVERALAAGQMGAHAERCREVIRQVDANLTRVEGDLARYSSAHARDLRALDGIAEPLEHQIRRARMFSMSELDPALRRAVRDTASSTGKLAELVLDLEAAEVDRAVLDHLRDPLVHLVRNAVVHGIEPPEVRADRGKAREGTIRVSASLRGGTVEVRVEDDGRGIDQRAVDRRAAEMGLSVQGSEQERLRLIFTPELSTSAGVTQFAGRGVGLDVVKSDVEAIHGRVELESTPGQGTTFSLTVPITLSVIRALLVSAGGLELCFASTNVVRLLRLERAELRTVEGREVLPFEGELLPLASLAGALGRALRLGAEEAKLPVVVVAAGARRAAFVVDALIAEREVVVQSLGPRLPSVACVAGATVLETGAVALLLRASDLLERVHRGGELIATGFAALALEARPERKTVLVVDDSVTTRTLEKTLLESAGYLVLTAADGMEAWQLLQSQRVDVVVSDVEMPRMDGFALTRALRESSWLRSLPVILVTGLGSDQDRARGLEAGASAYLVKSAFDQTELLEVVAQLA